jgi:hypothetical protein
MKNVFWEFVADLFLNFGIGPSDQVIRYGEPLHIRGAVYVPTSRFWLIMFGVFQHGGYSPTAT